MAATLHFRTQVLPGQRIELTDPNLVEGDAVEVTVVPKQQGPKRQSAWEFLNSLPPGPRAFNTWDEYERHLQAEKDSWDR